MPTYSREAPCSFGIYKHIVSGGDADHFAVLVIMRVWVIAVRVQIFVPCFGTDAFGGYVYTCTVCVYMYVYVYVYTHILLLLQLLLLQLLLYVYIMLVLYYLFNM